MDEFWLKLWNKQGQMLCLHCGSPIYCDNEGSISSGYYFHINKTDGMNGLYCSKPFGKGHTAFPDERRRAESALKGENDETGNNEESDSDLGVNASWKASDYESVGKEGVQRMVVVGKNNIMLLSDSYKAGHWSQYPPGTTNVYSYFESRGGEYDNTVFFGLQYILNRYLKNQFDYADINEAAEVYEQHLGSASLFNKAGWEKMWSKHYGSLPVRIKAVPEGTVVPTGNVLMTVENTDPEFPWVTNFLETLLSQVWYPTTVATVSYNVRKMILGYLEATGDPSLIDFKLHDFGFRGVSSLESAMIGGAAHLTSFLGTDTVPALTFLRDYYGTKTAAGFSVPASEHSTMTSWGKGNEVDAYRNMIQQYGGMPFYSVVSDSYDIFNAVENIWGGVLKDEVLAAPGTLVVRPDSGNPAETSIRVLELLAEKFGATKNEKDYLVLNPKVRMIWGDGLEPRTIQSILDRMKFRSWSADNIVFGMGGGLLQKVNRDTENFAFKCSSVVVDGEERDVYKQPVGQAMKVSKKGRLSLIRDMDGTIKTVSEKQAYLNDSKELLELVYENGMITRTQCLEDIRERVRR